jgi:hypothetical protein
MVAVLVLAAGFAPAQTGSGSSKSSSSKKGATSKKASTSKKGSASKTGSTKGRRSRKGAWKRKGQQKIDPARARQIQEALIREKYLQGEPTGVWDTRSEQAMLRYQADHGWQSKVTPDSRALIKLGLGPDHSQGAVIVPEKKAGTAAGTPVTAVTEPKR